LLLLQPGDHPHVLLLGRLLPPGELGARPPAGGPVPPPLPPGGAGPGLYPGEPPPQPDHPPALARPLHPHLLPLAGSAAPRRAGTHRLRAPAAGPAEPVARFPASGYPPGPGAPGWRGAGKRQAASRRLAARKEPLTSSLDLIWTGQVALTGPTRSRPPRGRR